MSVNMHAILVGLLSVSHTPEQADHAARSVLEQHAHALAEKVRAAEPDWDGDEDPWAAWNGAADLIDPAVGDPQAEGRKS